MRRLMRTGELVKEYWNKERAGKYYISQYGRLQLMGIINDDNKLEMTEIASNWDDVSTNWYDSHTYRILRMGDKVRPMNWGSLPAQLLKLKMKGYKTAPIERLKKLCKDRGIKIEENI